MAFITIGIDPPSKYPGYGPEQISFLCVMQVCIPKYDSINSKRDEFAFLRVAAVCL